MHTSLGLPSALLDLTFSRMSTRLQPQRALRHPCAARMMHQAAMALKADSFEASPPDIHPQAFGRRKRREVKGSLAVRRTLSPKVTELEKRVQALEVASAVEESVAESPSLSEEDLLEIYQDLLAISPESAPVEATSAPPEAELAPEETDQQIIEEADRRFSDLQTRPQEMRTPLADLLRKQKENATASTSQGLPAELQDSTVDLSKPYQRILSRVNSVLDQVEGLMASTSTQSSMLIGVLSTKECEALLRVCIEAKDGQAAENSILLIKRLGIAIPEQSVNSVLAMYADAGHISHLEQFLTRTLTGPPTEAQRHIHVAAHMNAAPLDEIPTSALSVLHSYEEQSLPAPMHTYTSMITRLFSTPMIASRAQAWDLFAHMRYAAHPNPDEKLYSLMIRACASPLVPGAYEPERALDLWTEMTLDKGLDPTRGTYNAVILACARSGRKEYINEAFRLAKQMLDAHRDAFGFSQFFPDNRTFLGLLDGAKRTGDLARARWILAEMVKNSMESEPSDVRVNEEVMMHVFHAYAAYQPPYKRANVTLVKDGEVKASKGVSSGTAETETTSVSERLSFDPNHVPSFAALPPQSRAEVLAEATYLFSRVLEGIGLIKPVVAEGAPQIVSEKKFQHVQLTPRLLNSYLAVFYRHAWMGDSREKFDSIFERYGVERNTRSYVEALERCAHAKRGRERDVALEWAESLWQRWSAVETALREDGSKTGRLADARLIERAHAAIIRVFASNNDLDRAMRHVRDFTQLYPPTSIRDPQQKPDWRSTRTVLKAARPLVRLTSVVEVPDDSVPPLLTFEDLELLHHRLVAAEMDSAIGKLKYVCEAYEGALRARRDATLRARPVA